MLSNRGRTSELIQLNLYAEPKTVRSAFALAILPDYFAAVFLCFASDVRLQTNLSPANPR